MPAAWLDPGADSPSRSISESLAGVAAGQAVDIGKIRVFLYLDDLTPQADVAIPVVVKDREAHLGIAANPLQALPRLVHVDQDASFLPVVPGDHGHRKSVGTDNANDRRVRLPQESVHLRRQLEHRHSVTATGRATATSTEGRRARSQRPT